MPRAARSLVPRLLFSEHMQGDEWGTYVTLERSALPERGMAYGREP